MAKALDSWKSSGLYDQLVILLKMKFEKHKQISMTTIQYFIWSTPDAYY